MKSEKSVYWMVTISLSYLLVAAIVAGIADAALTPIFGTSPIIQTAIGIVLYVAALWFAARHIMKKSIVSGSAITKTIVGAELFFLVVGGLLAFYSGSATLAFNVVINMVVVGVALYIFLNNAASTA